MGRKQEVGLDYFPFDINFFQDIKIRKLIKYQSGKAVTVYALLLCLIYKSGYYMRWDEELPFIISEQTGFEEAYILEVIRCCMTLGLLSKELYDKEKILTSKGIQKQFNFICKIAKRKSRVSEYSLIESDEAFVISSEEKQINSEEMKITSEEMTQSKVKENKENSLSGVKENFPPPEFAEKTLGECYTELSSNASWCEVLTMNTRNAGFIEFTPAIFQQYLQAFFKKLQNEGETRKSPKDAMSHFARWLKIELEKQRNNGSNRNAYTSKQEANAYALNLLQQHKRELEEGMVDEMEKPF